MSSMSERPEPRDQSAPSMQLPQHCQGGIVARAGAATTPTRARGDGFGARAREVSARERLDRLGRGALDGGDRTVADGTHAHLHGILDAVK